METIVVAQPVRQRQEAITTPVLPPDHVSEKYDGDTIAVYQKPESSALMDSSPHTWGWNNYDDDAEIYIPDRHQNNAPQRRDPNLSQDNIITGRRRRQAHYIEAAPDLSKYFAFLLRLRKQMMLSQLHHNQRDLILLAFIAMIFRLHVTGKN
ncbi:hypothetical protein P3342_004330 [Pyrenophora teres f. teres]|nr:hypothetical protein P3342_004330 [Pyrenophora teres f. teres]